MNLDEFDYLVRATVLSERREICFHMLNSAQIVGTISKLARYQQRVIGVELTFPEVEEKRDGTGTTVARTEAQTDMSTVFVPASAVIAAEWVA